MGQLLQRLHYLISPGALAEEPKAAAPLMESKHLLGDWGGARTALAAHGIIVDFDVTQFYQGVVSGSAGRSDWQYGVKGDLSVGKLGNVRTQTMRAFNEAEMMAIIKKVV